MTSCPEAMGWEFWDMKKKAISWDLDLYGASWFSELAEARPVGVYGMPARWLSQWVESWRCTNSQHCKKLCLSLLILENFKLKKVNNSFVPEPRKSSSVSNVFGFLCVWILWTFLHIWSFLILISGYVTLLSKCVFVLFILWPFSEVITNIKVKLSPFCRGLPESSLFNSYYTEV